VKCEYIAGAEYIVESIIPHLLAINAMQKKMSSILVTGPWTFLQMAH